MITEEEYFGKNYSLVKKEEKILDKKLKENFLKKYPYADMSKFSFESDFLPDGSWDQSHIYFINNENIQTDITSDTFKNDPNMTKYLYINKPHFPKIWMVGGEIQKLPIGRRHVGYTGKSYYWDNFPVEYILNYPINQFRIYVNDQDYFQSQLEGLNITTNDNARWNLKETYFQSIVGVRIATYACGISIQHLTFHPDIPKQITSLMRFHVYFTVKRIMRQCQMGDYSTVNKFDANFLQYHIPKWTWQEIMKIKEEKLGQDVIASRSWPRYKHGSGQLRDTQNDYRKFIPKISNGLTKKGTELLNQSIEAYLYSILGSQARTRQSIVSNRASSLEVQKVFRKIVADSIINYDTTTWINNMNEAVSDTNVILNTVISPTLWLIPSSFIILKNPIEGYNNKLKVSTQDMKFGINKGLNYQGEEHLKKLQGNKIANIKKSSNADMIFPLAIVAGILLSKYIL